MRIPSRWRARLAPLPPVHPTNAQRSGPSDGAHTGVADADGAGVATDPAPTTDADVDSRSEVSAEAEPRVVSRPTVYVTPNNYGVMSKHFYRFRNVLLAENAVTVYYPAGELPGVQCFFAHLAVVVSGRAPLLWLTRGKAAAVPQGLYRRTSTTSTLSLPTQAAAGSQRC